MKRICKKCGIEKEIEEFKKAKKGKNGRANFCKECHNSDNRGHRASEEYKKAYAEKRYCVGCKTCGIFFEAKAKEAKYCSKYCYGISRHGKGIYSPKFKRICKTCGIEKGIIEFISQKHISSVCESCTKKSKKEYDKKYTKENAEKIKARQKIHRQDNKEKYSEYAKKYRKENAEKVSACSKRCYNNKKHQYLEKNKNWLEKNKEKYRKYKEKYRKENAEELKKVYKKIYVENRAERLLYFKKGREEMCDAYVRNIIKGHNSVIEQKNIPQELVELKRATLKNQRLLREMKK